MNRPEEVSEGSNGTPQTNLWIPRIPIYGVLGICFLAVIWLWASFIRGRGGLGSEQFEMVALALLGIGLASWLNWRWIASAHGTKQGEPGRIFSFCFSAFLLLAIFLPEAALGKPLSHFRSFLLLGLVILLFLGVGHFVRRSLGGYEGLGMASPGRILFWSCVAYFLLTSWFTLAKLHAFGYVGQDIAYFTQCSYTTLHGHLFYSNMYHDLLYGQPVWSDYASSTNA
jgi:hypothetical protein